VGLSQADLLRNYVFMLLPTRAEHVYTTYWLPMQELLRDHLELLIYLDLVLRGDERAKQTELYRAQQRRLEPLRKDERALEDEVAELARRARHLKRIVEPTTEPNAGIQAGLQRLNTWGAQTTYPLVMHLLDLKERGQATSDEVVQALIYIESFLVRRTICAVRTGNLNRIFNTVVQQLPGDLPIDDAVRYALSGERKFWPADTELREAVRNRPFYWSGRQHQRVLVLQRLEESYPSRERVDFAAAKLSVEHVLPQTPTTEWLELLAEDAGEESSAEELHSQLVHTLGNLTLTAYNVELSNHPFERKQDLFKKSGLELNRAIAEAPRWGRTEILQRADELAARAATIWPGPVAGAREPSTGRDWSRLHRALAALPAGSWTTYGDLAALIGSHPVPVGTHLAPGPVMNAHRALSRSGKVSPLFRWPDPHDKRDPHEVLRNEGVRFDDTLVADPTQRMTAQDLADLLGLTEEEQERITAPRADNASVNRPELRESFFRQLREQQSPETVIGVERLLEFWLDLGGRLNFGTARETSCFLLLSGGERLAGRDYWPFALYPSGTSEVVFLYLRRRPPFDDEVLRERFRRMLNEAPGIDLPEAKLGLRPPFPLSALADKTPRERVFDALEWFALTARDPQPAAG
jgi:alkylated DNA nucleotide flippase Atl1